MNTCTDGAIADETGEEQVDEQVDERATDACDRCDRDIEVDRWIRLSTQPGPGLAGHYVAVSRSWCPDCVAAVGLLELARDR